MAEAWKKPKAGTLRPDFTKKVESARLEARGLNPLSVHSMRAQGIDISNHSSDVVNEQMINSTFIIATVCSHADKYCPFVPTNKEDSHYF